MWHTWYLMGASVGACAAMLTISLAARRLVREGTTEALASMIWSIVGSVLMLPFTGVIVAAAAFMVTR